MIGRGGGWKTILNLKNREKDFCDKLPCKIKLPLNIFHLFYKIPPTKKPAGFLKNVRKLLKET